MDIDKILFATDGSEESEKALDYTLYLAQALDSSVTALYVSEIHFPLTSIFPIHEDTILEIAEKTESKFKEGFAKTAERFKEKGVPFDSKIIRDGTVEGIIETASNEGAGLIVMGKHGHGFISGALIGSNTTKVLRSAQVPVLAVRSKGEVRSTDIKKILVPVDISEASLSALPEAISLADRLGAEVIAVYVFWLNGNAYEIPPGLVDDLIKRSKSLLSKTVQAEASAFTQSQGKGTDVKIKSQVLHGISPAFVLRDYAQNNSVDLIVVKTHGREGISRFLYGSETERIIQESPCPVLAVK